jgi:hypothetical protein
MIEVNLNADLRSVWLRLAGQFDAGVAEVAMHLPRKEDYSGSTPDASPILQESEAMD